MALQPSFGSGQPPNTQLCPKAQIMPHDAASLSHANPDLNVTERRVLDRIFQHPLSHNLSWREVSELFRAVGEVNHAHNGNLVLRLGTHHLTFEPAQGKDLAAHEVMALRHFLTQSGWSPTSLPVTLATPAAAALAIVIDHAGARIYDLPISAEREMPQETHHLHPSIDRTQHDADREETYPADHQFFDAIARDLPGSGRIVVISHGKGQSNEGAHFLNYLAKHHSTAHDRIACAITADLPHTTAPQLQQLARDALANSPEHATPKGSRS